MQVALRLSALAFGASVLLTAAACQPAPQPTMTYPATSKGDVVDDYFGTKVPTRIGGWRISIRSEVADWVAAQNRVTFDYLDSCRCAIVFKQRITELWDYPKVGVPVREGGRYFYQKNSGLQRQSPLYVRASLDVGALARARSERRCRRTARSRWRSGRRRPTGSCSPTDLSEGGADWRDASRARCRNRQGPRRRREVDAFLRHLVDRRIRRASSTRAIRSRRKERCSKPLCPGRRSTTIASARRSPRIG